MEPKGALSMKNTKEVFFWIYPKHSLGNLGATTMFYGTQAGFKKWLQKDSPGLVGRKGMSNILKNSAKFVKVPKAV